MEDSLDHFHQVEALAEILQQKITEANRWVVAAEKVPELLFERGIVESCGDELLATKMTNYL